MSILTRACVLVTVIVAASMIVGCSRLAALQGLPGPTRSTAALPTSAPGGDRYPDVLAVQLTPVGDGTYDVAVTMSSPYDSPARYADGWRVLDPAGSVLGTHTLLHDHAAEQPFTRTQRGLRIPDAVDRITVQGRDLANGFGGLTLSVAVPES